MLVRQHLRILKNHFTFHASWFYFTLYSDLPFLSKSLPQTKQNSLINIWMKIIFGNIMGCIIIRVSPRGTLTMIQSRVVKLNVKTFQIIQICFHAKNRNGSQFSISKPARTSPGRKSRFVEPINWWRIFCHQNPKLPWKSILSTAVEQIRLWFKLQTIYID